MIRLMGINISPAACILPPKRSNTIFLSKSRFAIHMNACRTPPTYIDF